MINAKNNLGAEENLSKEINEARQEQRSTAELIRYVLKQYVRARSNKRKGLSFIGVGESGRNDIAEHHEDLLWQRPSR